MAVIFDCSSNMAMFRKPYTTTSSVSFAFPPPTAVAGLISAIVGLNNGAGENAANADYWRALSGTRVAVSILGATRWLRAALNFWNVKNPQSTPHIQVKHQFLASPVFRIYVKGGVEGRLREKLEKDSFVYTPFLGVAYALAELRYRGECVDEAIDGENIGVDSVLPRSEGLELDVMASGGAFKEIVPLKFADDRALLESVTVLYSGGRGNRLVLKKRGATDVSRCAVQGVDDVIAWFPEW